MMKGQPLKIISHKRYGYMALGCHCPNCGAIYAWGRYTLENEEYILGIDEMAYCCGKDHPTPKLFQDSEEIVTFFKQLQSKRTQPALLIRKSSLETIHFDLDFFLKHWRRRSH